MNSVPIIIIRQQEEKQCCQKWNCWKNAGSSVGQFSTRVSAWQEQWSLVSPRGFVQAPLVRLNALKHIFTLSCIVHQAWRPERDLGTDATCLMHTKHSVCSVAHTDFFEAFWLTEQLILLLEESTYTKYTPGHLRENTNRDVDTYSKSVFTETMTKSLRKRKTAPI